MVSYHLKRKSRVLLFHSFAGSTGCQCDCHRLD